MTTLASLYEETNFKALTYLVSVDGHNLPVGNRPREMSRSFAFGEVPTCSFKLKKPVPSYVTELATVQVFVGFNGIHAPWFNGTIDSVSPDVDGVRIQCSGQSKKLENPYRRTVVTLSSITANIAVTNLLIAAGIASYVVDLPAWTIGTVVAQTLEFQSYAEAIIKIAEVDGSPWYETPSGQIRVERRDPIPASTAFRTYFSGVLSNGSDGLGLSYAQPPGVTNASSLPRLRTLSMEKLIHDVRNEISVRGAVIDTTGPEGETISDPLETTARGPSPWIPNPPEYAAMVFQNELMDTAAKVAEVAVRYFSLYNRLVEEVTLTIEGDPEIYLGATIQIEDPSYTGISGKYFVKSFQCTISGGDYSTQITAVGGRLSGTTPKLDPFADFTWSSAPTAEEGTGGGSNPPSAKFQQQVPAGLPGGPAAGGLGVIVTFDGRSSKDFDGQIVSWAWSDDAGHAGSGSTITFVYDPAVVSTVAMTLTVTDNDGLTDAVTKSVTIKADEATGDPTGDDSAQGGGSIAIPILYCAADNKEMGSADGGQTYNDLAVGTGTFISVSSRVLDDGTKVSIFGTTTGQLVRSTDVCATGVVIYTIAGGPRVEFVWADVIDGGIWWACTNNGLLYRSADEGLNWSLYTDFGDGLPLNRIATPGNGGLFVYGGDTSKPETLIRLDRSKTGFWISIAIAGAFLTAIQVAGAGFSVQEAASREGSDLAVGFTGGVSPVIWYSPDIYQDGTNWSAAVGLGVGACKALAPGFAGAGDLLAVIASTTTYSSSDGINFTAGANPSPSQINHLFWEGLDGVYIGAAGGGIVKTLDHGETWGYIRPLGALTWPGGSVGRMISFEAAPQQPPDAELYVIESISTDPDLYRRLTVGNDWATKDGAPPALSTDLRYFSAGEMIHSERHQVGDGFLVSPDYGETWGAAAKPGADWTPLDANRSPGGRLWLAWVNSVPAPDLMRVYYSDDFGATIMLSKEQTYAQVSPISPGCVATHPTDANRIAVSSVGLGGDANLMVTTDGGATWIATLVLSIGVVLLPRLAWIGGRLVLVRDGGTAMRIDVSDDDGATWTTKFSKVTGAGSSLDVDIIRAGSTGALFAFVGEGAPTGVLVRSLDHGDTWTEIGAFPTAGISPVSVGNTNAMAYDLLTDSLYLTFQNEVVVRKLANASSRDWASVVAGDWESLPDFDPVSANRDAGDRGLAVIGNL